ncbi:hypothetical protein SAMN05660909_05036 [Chitinophaga terrae (ex Kim and Jung 2007)]|uniref:Uncharacterized protein n=2 Tax=Chitinophaga TaxID=79328 RepID=A0A1H4G8P3_9BACT|nr:hypothetical protein SAMN05660909_05036 [Chitinophaga terrae (ex Kim and Jung 2007)]
MWHIDTSCFVLNDCTIVVRLERATKQCTILSNFVISLVALGIVKHEQVCVMDKKMKPETAVKILGEQGITVSVEEAAAILDIIYLFAEITITEILSHEES